MKKYLLSVTVCLLILFISGCATNQPMMDRMSRVETMQQTERSESAAEFQALKNDLENLRNRLDAIAKAQADLNSALDRQNELLENAINKIEHNSTEQRKPIPVPSYSDEYNTSDPEQDFQGSEPDQRPEVVYQTAYNDYINRNYDLAILEFQSFLAAFPDSALSDNAQYWIGECYYSQQRYDEALEEFNKVLQKYSDGDKYIPAMLKKGLCMIEKGNLTSGRSVLEKLVEDYPYSTEARIAQDRLSNP